MEYSSRRKCVAGLAVRRCVRKKNAKKNTCHYSLHCQSSLNLFVYLLATVYLSSVFHSLLSTQISFRQLSFLLHTSLVSQMIPYSFNIFYILSLTPLSKVHYSSFSSPSPIHFSCLTQLFTPTFHFHSISVCFLYFLAFLCFRHPATPCLIPLSNTHIQHILFFHFFPIPS